VVVALLLGGGLGAFVALLLQVAVRNTPVVVNPGTFFWWLILLSSCGAVAGLALESVRQLQVGSAEPEFRRRPAGARRAHPAPANAAVEDRPHGSPSPPGAAERSGEAGLDGQP
jgi:hypothetical protein